MSEADKFGRIPAQLVEIDQPKCAHVYGQGGCSAVLGETGERKCFNTLRTCQVPDDYDGSDTLTLRFSVTNQVGMPNDLLHVPSLIDASQQPARLSVGGTNESVSPLGARATLTATFLDHPYSDILTDPYRTERDYNPMERGTFWGKWKARNEYRRGMPVRYRSCYLVDGELVDHQVYNYLLEKIDGPDSNGKVAIKAFDILQSLKADRATFPVASTGRLESGLAEGGTSFVLAPTGVGSEYPASFRCRIGGEGFDVTRSGDSCTINTRGLYGGVEDHEADDTVQVVARFQSARVHDIAYDIVTTAVPELANNIDKPAWNGIADEYLPRLYSADITEPTGVEDLLTELTLTAPIYWYADVRTNRIIMDAVREPSQAARAITERGDIIGGSVSVSEYPKERIDEVWVYYRIRDAAEDVDDENNYSQRFILVNPEEQIRRGGTRAVKRVFTRWIEAGARDTAEEIAQSLISRFQETPIRISFDLDAKDGEIWLGDVVRPDIRMLQDDTGANRTDISYQIIEAEESENGTLYRYIAQSYEFFRPITPDSITISIEPEDTRDEQGRIQAINLRSLYDAVVATEIANIKFRILGGPGTSGGTLVGGGIAVSTADTDSLILPNDWPWLPDITLTVEPGAAVIGRAGSGGNGGYVTGDPDNMTRAAGGAGGGGGDGLVVNYPLTVNNNGIIAGGGGGGGGGGVGHSIGGGGAGGGGGLIQGGYGNGGQGMNSHGDPANPGSSGTDGSLLSGGNGGAGGDQKTLYLPSGQVTARGGKGGNGGDPGQAGQAGERGYVSSNQYETAGGAGGAPGRAIVGIANVTFINQGDIRGSTV